MGGWYWIGVCAGLGAAAGVVLAGLAGRALAAALVGAAVGAAIGFGVHSWQSGGWADVAVAAVGGVLGGFGTGPVVRGALGRGGTRGGTSVLVAVASLVVAGLAFVPVLGYVEALVLPALATRLRKRAPERYAGLRTLARD